jgi:hypothetical protein
MHFIIIILRLKEPINKEERKNLRNYFDDLDKVTGLEMREVQSINSPEIKDISEV